MMDRRGQLAVYKGVSGKHGAIQVEFWEPQFDDKGYLTKAGGLRFTITSATGPNKYDWGNKISMHLKPTEMAELFSLAWNPSGNGEMKCVHQFSPEGTDNVIETRLWVKASSAGLMFVASRDSVKHSVGMSVHEAKMLALTLMKLVPMSFGF